MAFVVAFDRLAFQRHKLDEAGNPTIEPDGPEQIVRKGYKVPDYVPPWQLAALANSGMIAFVADPPTPEPAPAPALHAVPEAIPLRTPVTPVDPDAADFDPESAETVNPEPATGDSRAAWEEYATSQAVGMTEDEARGYRNKTDLIAAVAERRSNPTV